MNNNIKIYKCKDNRLRVYNKSTKKVMSYPKYLMEQKLKRKLLPEEQVHHIDNNPLNNDMSNLEIQLLGEHQKHHMPPKYHDKKVICTQCGQEFIITAKQQRTRTCNQSRKNKTHSDKYFCSKHCVGLYGTQIQNNKRKK